jgi:hypothetical protein
MANNSLKVSELPIANSAAPADRLVILRSPASNPSVRTITVSSLTANLSYANTTTAGVVKVGDNLSINATGHLSVSGINLSYANTTTAGVVKVGTNLTVNATGYLNSLAGGNTGSWTFDGTKANTGGSQNSFIDGQSPGGLLLYNDYVVTLLANNAYYEFNQNGTLTLPDNGTIKVNGVTVAGDIVSNPADGVNDNVWRIINVNGYKEFNYQTPGHLKIHIPITSGLAGTKSQITVNLASQDLTALRDAYDYGSNIRVYLNDLRNNDHGVPRIEGTGFLANNSLGVNQYNIYWNGGDITLVEGEELTLQYYTRGTKDLYGAWEEYDTFWPDQTTANTNQVVIDFDTFDYLSADSITALKNNSANCGITFYSNGNGQLDIDRKIVSVANTGDLYTITFDGAPIDITTPTLQTITVTHARNSDGNNNYIEFDSKRYPEFTDCIYAENNKYTGNSYRSGYVIINGDTGNPYDFTNENYISNEGMFVINLSTSYTINPTDTVEIHFYKTTNIGLYIYQPEQQQNYFYGKKWFDWTDDLPQKYYNFVGNGVQGGTIKTHVGLYDQATKEWDSATFPEAAFDTNDFWDTWNGNQSYGSIYPFTNFDQDGLYFYSDWTGWGDSRTLKVRIMYKMELMISEFENNYWF